MPSGGGLREGRRDPDLHGGQRPGRPQPAAAPRTSGSRWERLRRRSRARRTFRSPLGHFKSPFFDGGKYYAYVRFHAAWPVYCDDAQALVVTQYRPGMPVIVVRRVGKGLVAVIGDTCFAMNKNLEHEDGSPFEGLRENADFWRWFLALLGDNPKAMWYPPKPKPESK